MDSPDKLTDYFAQSPTIHSTAYISRLSYLRGAVTVSEFASVWPFCSLRADLAPIRIGAYSNIQDGSVVHVADGLPAVIGEWVTVGHKAVLHACNIADEVLVGMGAIILDGAKVGTRSIIGANATVTMNIEIPPGSLVLGSPATVKRRLTDDEQSSIRGWAERYITLSRRYLERSD